MKNLIFKVNDCAVVNKRTRQSNFELARIFSMVLVLILHSTYSALGWPEEVDGISCGRLLVESLAIVGVNVFVLISGYFSIEPKLKSIKNFIFICLFYGIFSMIYHLSTGEFSIRNVFFVSSGNWFVVSYIGLLIVSPFLNSLINSNIRWGGYCWPL